ncbi:hypothetical protein FHR71_005302 [Methylobacterium sp. RAS18]|nr:hypothetical protein [Methylobacterium sp. RAS18]
MNKIRKVLSSSNVAALNSDISGLSCLIFAIGFETRSRYVFERSQLESHLSLAIKYSVGQVLSYESNLELALKRGVNIVDDTNAHINVEICKLISKARVGHSSINIGIDVSAMNRSIMAEVLSCVYGCVDPSDSFTVLYTPALFRQPDVPFYPLKSIGAAHPAVSGIITEPGRERNLILGLGYEYGISLNILDMHEPDLSFIFRPIGYDPQYDTEVRDANFDFDFGDRNYEIIDYRLSDPARLYADLTSLINSSLSISQTTIVPLGPKIFSAVSIIAALMYKPLVPVLRYSINSFDNFIDVDSDGIISGCEFKVIRFDNAAPEMEVYRS